MTVVRFRKRPVEVETMLWDGTLAALDEIHAWVGSRDGETLFLAPSEVFGVVRHAQLWVDHSTSWVSVPVGHRVVKELDGKGFYPLSPEGLAAGYEAVPR